MYMTNDILNDGDWNVVKTGKHSSKLVWHRHEDGMFGRVRKASSTETNYECPRGHTFKTTNPIIIAVEDEPEYNSGPICSYCYVDWFKLNLNARESSP